MSINLHSTACLPRQHQRTCCVQGLLCVTGHLCWPPAEPAAPFPELIAHHSPRLLQRPLFMMWRRTNWTRLECELQCGLRCSGTIQMQRVLVK